MFSDTPNGAHASANLYSLVESAKANGIDPYAYLRYLFTELPKAKAKFEQDYTKYLPWRVKDKLAEK